MTSMPDRTVQTQRSSCCRFAVSTGHRSTSISARRRLEQSGSYGKTIPPGSVTQTPSCLRCFQYSQEADDELRQAVLRRIRSGQLACKKRRRVSDSVPRDAHVRPDAAGSGCRFLLLVRPPSTTKHRIPHVSRPADSRPRSNADLLCHSTHLERRKNVDDEL